MRDFSAAYRGKLTALRHPEGSHGFRESKDRLVGDMAGWLGKAFP